MSEPLELSAPERDVLLAALHEPLFDRDPMVMGLCLRLCGRHLMQRAGGAAIANGWRGSPYAFVLSREGWNLVKSGRLRAPIRRAG
ncbi:MAG TPA: hypothetical protein VNW53_05780 [Phenylobacterium sp.]|jgi:hypothetical protein|uniref:hypothetical protein n=1 Tax=Phenylobacterium sp. TaxID=1871053 RepID=UPI002C873F3E|nr:hypothetical protein [Phenylobacterium sp.]HXA38491.1 hypothetical protein [Phenylobacterium sp.]